MQVETERAGARTLCHDTCLDQEIALDSRQLFDDSEAPFHNPAAPTSFLDESVLTAAPCVYAKK